MTLLEVTERPSESDLSAIGDSIAAYNDADIGPSGRQPLAVFDPR